MCTHSPNVSFSVQLAPRWSPYTPTWPIPVRPNCAWPPAACLVSSVRPSYSFGWLSSSLSTNVRVMIMGGLIRSFEIPCSCSRVDGFSRESGFSVQLSDTHKHNSLVLATVNSLDPWTSTIMNSTTLLARWLTSWLAGYYCCCC